MKKILKSLLLCSLAMAIIAGCKKHELADIGEGTFVAKAYTFNRATKTFDLGDEVKGNIAAADGVKFVYCYLVRTNATDSLILVTDNRGDVPANYDLTIPLSKFPLNNMSKVKGVKVMVKQGNNTSLEGFITINYFDPSMPQFSSFPTSLTANLGGGTTAIAGTIKSEYGIKQVDIYDDYQTENTYVLVNSVTGIANVKEYALNYAYTYRKAAQHIKVVATDIYNQTGELIIDMPVDLSIFKPKFLNFAASITPNLSGSVPVGGQITSVTGLKKVDIYDDRDGTYQLLGTANNLGGVNSYNYSANYTFAMRAEHIKIIAVDAEDLQAELVIPVNYTYLSKLYKDVLMTAQTVGTNTAFFDADGTTKGNCDLQANESLISFLLYYVSSSNRPTFYSPGGSSGVAANFKCSGAGWVQNTSVLRATKFRVLQTSVAAEKPVYDDFLAGNLDDLAARLSSLSIGSNTVAYDATAATSNTIFNTTTAYLIAVKIPDVGPTASVTTFKYALIRVREAKVTDAGGSPLAGNSTLKFDIYIQK